MVANYNYRVQLWRENVARDLLSMENSNKSSSSVKRTAIVENGAEKRMAAQPMKRHCNRNGDPYTALVHIMLFCYALKNLNMIYFLSSGCGAGLSSSWSIQLLWQTCGLVSYRYQQVSFFLSFFLSLLIYIYITIIVTIYYYIFSFLYYCHRFVFSKDIVIFSGSDESPSNHKTPCKKKTLYKFMFALRITDKTAITDVILYDEEAQRFLNTTAQDFYENDLIQQRILSQLIKLKERNVMIDMYLKLYTIPGNNNTNNNSNNRNNNEM
jgi:hypothetical protein